MEEKGPKLSVVATPIGNLEDITLRALRVLKEADVVACEDTRTSSKLLSHFEIHTSTVSFHTHSGEKGFAKIISLLEEGKHVALISDAGTPGVSDPGQELVSVVRERVPETKIETIPGPSALAAALAIAGMRAASFVFYGFLPLKKGRETIMKEIAASKRASIFYESPHRIHKSVNLLITFLHKEEEGGGEISDRRVGIFRELTKLHEDAFVGSPAEALNYLESDPNHQRGEFVVVVEGK
jgi:16S rRNA (cytidine1402-2'-O)-methyltransferase